MPARFCSVLILIAWPLRVGLAHAGERTRCEADAEVRRELEKTLAATAADHATVEQITEALPALRDRFPGDLFIHLRYQDVINERGVQGHLDRMFGEYLALKTQHPDDPFHLYLFGRALEGRMTLRAASTMEEVLELDPGFALAHRTLAEIYSSARFRDREKARTERSRFQEACPGAMIPVQPPPLPRPGNLSGVERLIGRDDPEDRVAELVYRALLQDEWRLQRIRPFDWYTVERKKQAAREAQARQWKGWTLLVRHYRAIRQDSKAQALLLEMQDRFRRIHGDREPDLFWSAATALLELCAEGRQPDTAREMLKQIEKSPAAKAGHKRSAQLAKLKSRYAAP